MDKHELGYQPVTDEEFQASLYRDGNVDGGIFLPREEWSDPRKGDLFALVELLERARSREAKENGDT